MLSSRPSRRIGTRIATLLELSLQTEVADLLADLLAAQEVDDLAAENDDDQQREDDRRRGAERNVLEHARTGQVVGFVQILEDVIEHIVRWVLFSE